MLLKVLTSPHIGLSNPLKLFQIWACSVRNKSVFGNFKIEEDANAKSLLDEVDVLNECKRYNYVPHPDVSGRSDEEIKMFRDENEITIKGDNIPHPILNLEEANFPAYIMNILGKQEFTKPTPIQSQCWPIALQGDNMVGIARTGSGKTLAYLVPSIIRINEERANARGPFSLVLAPTRELAVQIKSVATWFKSNVKSAAIYGGAGRYSQEVELGQRPDIVIATPGRLLDFLRSDVITLQNCSYIVLDEADRMLDMGFEPQIRDIMDRTEEDKQVLMWSATWPKEIRSLAEDYLRTYTHVTVGSGELTANPNITQIIEFCNKFDKVHRLIEFLRSNPDQKTLIFFESKRAADEIRTVLYRKGFKAEVIHGDKSQTAREMVLGNFRSGRTEILCATDVAARGLDVDNIEFVINFELPKTIESYVHRIGRTARHEKRGTAFSLMTEEDKPIAKDLVELLNQCGQEVPEQLKELGKDSVRISFRNTYAKKNDNWSTKPRGGFNSFSQRGGQNWGYDGNRNRSRTRNMNWDFRKNDGRSQRRPRADDNEW